MIRTPAASRPARAGAALAGVAGILALAGCAGAGAGTGTGQTTDPVVGGGGQTAESGSYADGTYTAEGTYATPESVETISVTLTVEGDTVTAVEVVGDPQKSESHEYQSKFIGGIADEVVGKDIDELDVSRVAGSSLTSGGFNQALDAIKQQAAA